MNLSYIFFGIYLSTELFQNIAVVYVEKIGILSLETR